MADQPGARLPRHVGIIMDGNGRWAQKRGLPRSMGHRQGAKTFGDIALHAAKSGVAYLSVYAFSTENWKRPADEVESIMSLLRSYLKDLERYKKHNIRVKVIGDVAALDPDLRESIRDLEEKSAACTGMHLNIALNYGGQDELVHAVRGIVQKVCRGGLPGPDAIDANTLSEHLYTAGQPEVDLMIRTSGERRISNFMLWQSAYAEFVFTDVLWPDFSAGDFDAALEEFALRTRTMGAIDNERGRG